MWNSLEVAYKAMMPLHGKVTLLTAGKSVCIKCLGRFQFTDAPHLHYIFPHFSCLTFTNFMSITVITNPCRTNIVTGACPAYCSWPRCHHSQTINLCPTAVRNCPHPPEKVVHHIVLQQYCQPQRPCKPLCLRAPATEQVVPGSLFAAGSSAWWQTVCFRSL